MAQLDDTGNTDEIASSLRSTLALCFLLAVQLARGPFALHNGASSWEYKTTGFSRDGFDVFNCDHTLLGSSQAISSSFYALHCALDSTNHLNGKSVFIPTFEMPSCKQTSTKGSRSKATIKWMCHNCRAYPMVVATTPSCTNCEHVRCSSCEITTR
jgi:hypothetical protein